MGKNLWKIISLTLIIVIIIAISLFYFYKRQLLPPNFIRVSIGHDVLLGEIANTPAERELGLANRHRLSANQGMIFIFDHPDRYGFWMKDTLIPLDMFWIDANKTIVDIKSDVLPETYPEVFTPKELALYVLETNAGYAKSHGIEIGDKINF